MQQKLLGKENMLWPQITYLQCVTIFSRIKGVECQSSMLCFVSVSSVYKTMNYHLQFGMYGGADLSINLTLKELSRALTYI